MLVGAGLRVAVASTVLVALAMAVGWVLPRGGQLAFQSNREGYSNLYVMDVERGVALNFTHSKPTISDPNWTYGVQAWSYGTSAWSPDGSLLAYESNRESYWEWDIFLAGAGGHDMHRLLGGEMNDRDPAWSPDGKRIVFVSNRGTDTTANLFLMDSACDGACDTGILRLTRHLSVDEHPAWSPDGQRIAFVSNHNGNREIFLVESACVHWGDCAQALRRLTDNDDAERHPSWSPDGQRIAFVSDRDGNDEIYVMGGDGSKVERLTYHNASDWSPVWSPDGRQIAFESSRDGNWEIYVMDEDGTHLRRLTYDDARDSFPAWRP